MGIRYFAYRNKFDRLYMGYGMQEQNAVDMVNKQYKNIFNENLGDLKFKKRECIPINVVIKNTIRDYKLPKKLTEEYVSMAAAAIIFDSCIRPGKGPKLQQFRKNIGDDIDLLLGILVKKFENWLMVNKNLTVDEYLESDFNFDDEFFMDFFICEFEPDQEEGEDDDNNDFGETKKEN